MTDKIEETRTRAQIEKAVDEVIGAFCRALIATGVPESKILAAATLVAEKQESTLS